MVVTQVDVSDIHLRDIRFQVTRKDGRVVDFSDLVTNFRWADHVNLAAVEINLNLAGSLQQVLKTGGEGSTARITAPLIDVNTGQVRRQELWRGIFEDVVDQRSEGLMERVITAYDILHNFAVNEEDLVFKGSTLSGILTKICKNFQVPIGDIAKTTKALGTLIGRGDTLWDFVQKAQQKHFNLTGQAYRIFAQNGRIQMVLQGSQDFIWRFEDKWSLQRVRRSRSISQVINAVKIYGTFEGEADKPAAITTKGSPTSQKLYGLRQRIDYANTDDEQEVIDTARETIKLFAFAEETLEITGWLVPNLRAGEQIRFRDTEYGINRLYFVESMEANWSAEMADSIAQCQRSEIDPGIILDEITVA